MKVDLLLRNGLIHTMDGRRTASSVAIWNGRVIALDEELDARRVVDLRGRAVTPGWHDAHNHMAMFGIMMGELDLSYDAVHSLDELYAAVRAAADAARPGDWIVGARYDQNKLGAHPTLQRLDEIAPQNPVWLKHTSGHMAVVNSAVLRQTDADHPPEGGVVVRDEAGQPTGLLQEQAQRLVQDLVRPYSQRQLVEAITRASAQYAAEGLVGVTEAGIGAGWVGNSPVEAAAYQEVFERGLLKQRVTLMPVSDALHTVDRGTEDGPAYALDLGLRTGFGGDMLRLGPLKVFSDGSLIGHTAAMCEEFANAPGEVGFLQEDVESLKRKIRGGHRAGWQVATHAIGDRAVSTVLDIYEEVLAELPRADHRHRIEHCGVSRPDDVERLLRLGVIPVPQGRFIEEIGDGMMTALGAERSEWCYRGQSFLAAGGVLPGSSDRPVVLGAPLLGMQAMVTRRTGSGQLLGAAEAVSAYDAVRAYTAGSTYANRSDDVTGTLEVGKYADLVVLDRDPLQTPGQELGGIGVLATMVAGELTHGEL
ncbi:amidohydrolase [Cumulibacter manganitolerans]|uniref:amidohydrolase n=1 Tax=Cumulibacter manganitolerans TaxID=1884992 RepID=UPI0012977097|nr:amidohydrolase [Cumulibacter manganitolerans]